MSGRWHCSWCGLPCRTSAAALSGCCATWHVYLEARTSEAARLSEQGTRREADSGLLLPDSAPQEGAIQGKH